jgi:hypothetical protein
MLRDDSGGGSRENRARAGMWCYVVLYGVAWCYMVLCGVMLLQVLEEARKMAAETTERAQVCGVMSCYVLLSGVMVWYYVVVCGVMCAQMLEEARKMAAEKKNALRCVVSYGVTWCYMVLRGLMWCYVMLCGVMGCSVCANAGGGTQYGDGEIGTNTASHNITIHHITPRSTTNML